MAITQEIKFYVGIQDNGLIEIRRIKIVKDNGDVYEKYFRFTLEPGENVSSQPLKIRQICNLIWTPQVVADYIAWKNSQ